jgi:biotin operon repressor
LKPEISKEQLTELEIRVLNHLEYGHNNAISLKNLCLRTKMPERKIRKVIEALRREQWAILIHPSPPWGYFLAATKEELEEYNNYMRHRLIEEYRTYKIVKNATIKKFDRVTQLPLFMG